MTSSKLSFHLSARAEGLAHFEISADRTAVRWNEDRTAATRSSHVSMSSSPCSKEANWRPCGEGAHHHHMVHRFTIHHEVGHPEVHVGGQPTVELDLAAAVRGASSAIPEIQKVEMNGLVDLVDLVSEEEKNRDVRLRDPHWCSSEIR